MHPTSLAGEISYSWLERRSAASATLTGRFCAVTAAESIAALRPQFVVLAHLLNLHDFDAAARKDGRPRALTQSVATYLHATTELNGVTFRPPRPPPGGRGRQSPEGRPLSRCNRL